MKARVTIKLDIEDLKEKDIARISQKLDEAMQGTFGKAVWELGTFADSWVEKVKVSRD